MSCPTCNNANGPVSVGGLSSILATINAPCNTSICPSPQDCKCTFYSAGNLPCSGINTNDSIELALQKIDTQLCASAANYSSYNTSCITPHATQQQWVEAISAFVCTTNTSLNTFITTTFPAYQTTISAALVALQVPGTTSTCSNNPIVNTDTIQAVLQKLSNMACDIYGTQLSLAGVNWNICTTVSPTPTTVAAGFNALISQICTLQTNISNVALPVFNNVGSCLPAPLTTTDSLVSTVNKIKTLLCQTPVFNINSLTWNCVTKPSSTTTDLQGAFQALLTKLDTLSQAFPSFSSDFGVVAVDPSHPCSGVKVSLSTTIADRKVAATPSDGTPGTLAEKLVGDGVTIDVDYSGVTQGVVKYIGTAPGLGDGLIFTDVSDAVKDYLQAKLVPGSIASGLGISVGLDASVPEHKLKLGVTIDPIALFTALLNAIPADTTGVLATLFCSAMNNCPSPCAAPSNITFVFGGSTSSSTTTTTTTVAPTTTTSSTSTTTTTGVPTTTTSSTTTTTTTIIGTTTTTTSTTSTSSTSSSTTTTTTTLDIIFVGAQSGGTPPVAATILAGNITSQNGANNVVADWTPFNATPQFTWVAIPNKGGTYTKNNWFQTVVNNGTIGGGGSAFATPTTVVVSGNSYLVYITNFATQWTGTVLMEN